MEAQESRKRRRYGPELKQQILAECAAPGASVAKVALSHGINANIVHGWRKLARQGQAVEVPAPHFVPVTVAAAAPVTQPRGIEVEFRRGAATIRMTWLRIPLIADTHSKLIADSVPGDRGHPG